MRLSNSGEDDFLIRLLSCEVGQSHVPTAGIKGAKQMSYLGSVTDPWNTAPTRVALYTVQDVVAIGPPCYKHYCKKYIVVFCSFNNASYPPQIAHMID